MSTVVGTSAWVLAVLLVGLRIHAGGPVSPVWFWPMLALVLSVAVTMSMIAAFCRALPSVTDVFSAGAEWGAEHPEPPRRRLHSVR